MKWLKINGTDFNLEVGTYSLEEFKKEFRHSFCVGRTDQEIVKVHAQLKAVVIPTTVKTDSHVINSGNEKKTVTVAGKGSKLRSAGT